MTRTDHNAFFERVKDIFFILRVSCIGVSGVGYTLHWHIITKSLNAMVLRQVQYANLSYVASLHCSCLMSERRLTDLLWFSFLKMKIILRLAKSTTCAEQQC